MKLDINNFGERLQMLRKALDIPQAELAARLEVGQNQISRLENGIGGSLELLFSLINFYSEHFYVNGIFSEDFEVIKRTEQAPQKSVLNSIAVERLKFIQTDLGQQLSDVIDILEKEGTY